MERFFGAKPKLIYVMRIPYESHRDCLKIGEATYEDGPWPPIQSSLNKAAKARIDQYTKTAGIPYELLHSEISLFVRNGQIGSIDDHQVHEVLKRSGIEKKEFEWADGANEWFVCDLETSKKAIEAAKAGRKSLHPAEKTENHTLIDFRPEQREAIDKTLKQFKKSNQMLWNAKMRFGKTLSALQVVKEYEKFRRVLILTHRPVVDAGWFEDFGKIFYDTPDFAYGSKTNGEPYANLEARAKRDECRYVYFASIQDLRGSELVGGNFDKNNEVFATPWDLIIVDEAHEGTQTALGKAVMNELVKKDTKVLRLSGTPFNLLDDFKEDEIYTWDYVMEQRAKAQWDIDHPGDYNPYSCLPRLNIYTYDLGRLMKEFADEDIAFNFREFFRTKEDGTFVHEKDVWAFLNLLTKKDTESQYPFANEAYRNIFRHTLWMLPGVKAAKALSAMLKTHPVFSCFEVVNVAGDGDEDEENREALRMVEGAIGKDPDQTRTITLSCGRLTTGVSVKAWTGVFMLSGSYNTAASAYMQTIFRVQTPATINGRVKEECYVFDFAPDRTLKVLAETAKISTKAGKQSGSERQQLGDFLNFCPIISVEGSKMSHFNVDNMLQQLKKVYVERVVRNGFEDRSLYNDELSKLSDIEIVDFNDLKGIVGQTKAIKKSNDIDINKQGLTNEEYEEQRQLETKKKKELTEAEKARLEELKKKSKLKDNAISILRGISIRMPLLIYGADITDEDKELTIDNFTQLVDAQSWEEFMPKGVTKQKFNAFKKYYDPDIFAAAGKRIRQMARAADNLTIEERIERIATIFSTFRNPDKETVLTPWRVVNMHMSDCLGGYCFFNDDFSEPVAAPRLVTQEGVTNDVFSTNSCLLEINSKSGLYPLYLAYNIYRTLLDKEMFAPETIEEHRAVWDKAVAEHIFVICRTPMAKSITRRTLLGFRKGKTNMWAPEDLINKIKNQSDLFIKKVHDLVGKDMKIKAIVGNPPYQVVDGGGNGAAAVPIYNKFVSIAKSINPNYISMIMPAKWYGGGRGLDEFRAQMLKETHIDYIKDFPNPKDCFATANISGGVCYFRWNASYNSNRALFVNVIEGKEVACERELAEFLQHDIFPRYNDATSILHKVLSYDGFESLSEIVAPYKPFGLRTYERGAEKKLADDNLVLHTSKGTGYISRGEVKTGLDYVDKFNVITGKALSGHLGETDENGQVKVLATTKIIYPNEVCTESYIVIGKFSAIENVEALYKYVISKFARFLLLQALPTLDIRKERFIFVPMQDFTADSDIDWSKSITEIDAQLYAKYGLSSDEIAFIDSMIKPME